MIPYTKQSINDDDIQAVGKSLKADWITRGPLTVEFEEAFAQEVNAKFAVSFNSGTAALDAATRVAEISSNDRVLTSPNTFVGTVAGAVKADADIVLGDIDPNTGNLSLDSFLSLMNQPSTRGKELLLPVHYGGIALDMRTISQKITKASTVVIEDAAHALGSYYPSGEKVGSCVYSDMTIFSFHPAKQITTGEGGIVTTNSSEIVKKLKLFRNNGIIKGENQDPWIYFVTSISGNYHLTEFQAALGLSQLKRLTTLNKGRSRAVEHYRKFLEGNPYLSLVNPSYDPHTSYHLLVVRIPFDEITLSRGELMKKLEEGGIGSQVHYIPLHYHPALKGRLHYHSLEGCESFYQKALTLPLFSEITKKEIEKVVKLLTSLLVKRESSLL